MMEIEPERASYLPDLMPPEIAALRDSSDPVWIFAYGSLMWDREFPRSAAEPALLRGYHRRFCLYSYDYRGTRNRPGLILGLDRGGACRGIALRLPTYSLAETIDALWLREMTAPRVYDMRRLLVQTGSGGLPAFAFIVRRDHPDYAGRLSLEETARVIAGSAGRLGTNRDYLAATLRHLTDVGRADAALVQLSQRVEALVSACG
jgi:cation transport protein ChaC